ncbi:myrosinase 1-like isoform X2 [Diabrotica virgifera virgifera]|uniref:Myrosinase 1-like isoform X2 n=1 Tax=Diabrotica virgifera virgifera TaxID=50390 RepID=A0A6P7FB82_DIAVI|nr:myrosinase 1-like isoform X2 [Diabrotica virgifera virgifera]
MEYTFCLLFLWVGRTTSAKLPMYDFPKKFSFGVATSAFQIEGGWNASGKGVSIWDHLVHDTNEIIVDGSNADVACDSYNKVDYDILLLKALGVSHYRFSIAWTRILPNGFRNHVSEDGVKYYNYLINKLLENGIEPWVTIFHFDIPYGMFLIGGMFNEKFSEYLSDYADLLFNLYGDRVKTWVTINEPYSVCVSGTRVLGEYRPNGIVEYLCGHTFLKAHAAVYDLYQRKYKSQQNGKISMAFNLQCNYPETNSAEDIEAAERANQFALGWFVHPVVFGNYPQVMIDSIANISKTQGFLESRLPVLTAEDQKLLKGSFDFIGLNNYDTYLVSDDRKVDVDPSYINDQGVNFTYFPNWTVDYSIEMRSKGLGIILNWIKKTYNDPEIRILEQGFPETSTDLYDHNRHKYIVASLQQLWKSINEDNVNVTAYTFWSLMDNFEWDKGYSVRYGLNYVDFNDPNRIRIPRLSAITYNHVSTKKTLRGLL